MTVPGNRHCVPQLRQPTGLRFSSPGHSDAQRSDALGIGRSDGATISMDGGVALSGLPRCVDVYPGFRFAGAPLQLGLLSSLLRGEEVWRRGRERRGKPFVVLSGVRRRVAAFRKAASRCRTPSDRTQSIPDHPSHCHWAHGNVKAARFSRRKCSISRAAGSRLPSARQIRRARKRPYLLMTKARV